MISLTATPPYEGDPALWDRYIRMCGEIDEEITVPELVKEETLCPHQDYVYFAFPTKEEQEQLDAFSQQKNALLQQLTSDPSFANTSKTAKPYRVRSAMMNCSMIQVSLCYPDLSSKQGNRLSQTFPGPLRSQETTCFHPGLA